MNNDRELMQAVLEAMESLHRTGDTQVFDMYAAPVLIPALRERLAQPEQSPLDRMAENARELGLDYEPVQKEKPDGLQTTGPLTDRTDHVRNGGDYTPEPVAMRYDFDGYGYRYIDSGSGSNWQTRIKDAEPLYAAPPQPDTKVNSEAIPKQISAPVAHSIVAGALFDFMGWLTTRREPLVLSGADDAAPAADAIRDFAQMRSLSINDAQVQEWQKHLATPPRREWQGLTDEEWAALWEEFAWESELTTEEQFQEEMIKKHGKGHYYMGAEEFWNRQKDVIQKLVNAKLKEKNV